MKSWRDLVIAIGVFLLITLMVFGIYLNSAR